jgi:shikimate kinase
MPKFFLIGFMGSGKSHWGKKWSAQLNLPFFDLDDEIERAEGQTISEIFYSKGEEYLRRLESEVLKSFQDKENFILACGGGTPCFNNNMDWINKNGASIYLKTAVESLYNRLVTEKSHRPLIKDLSDEQLMPFIKSKLEEREPYYLKADIVVDEEMLARFHFHGIQ